MAELTAEERVQRIARYFNFLELPDCKQLEAHIAQVIRDAEAAQRERDADIAERWGCLDRNDIEAAFSGLAAAIRKG